MILLFLSDIAGSRPVYIPSKHMVVSRRDATFNQAYLPARVGETTLIRTKTMIDGAGESGTIENDTKNSSNDTKTVQNDTKNNDMIAPDFNVSKSTPNESKTVLNGPKTTQNNTKHTKSESNSGLIDGSIDGSKPNDHHNDRQKEARAINDILNKLLQNPNAIIRKTSKTS